MYIILFLLVLFHMFYSCIEKRNIIIVPQI